MTLLGYDFVSSFEDLTQNEEVDCFIVATVDGFSPLGLNRGFFARELSIDEKMITELADWNRLENDDVSIIGLKSRNPESRLKGIILAASEASSRYQQLASIYSRPYRDFYYNVTYESIAYGVKILGAKKIAISHLSRSKGFHEDIATCQAEALAHFCDKERNYRVHSFSFVGCCIHPTHLLGIQSLNRGENQLKHRDIDTKRDSRDGYDVISLRWY